MSTNPSLILPPRPPLVGSHNGSFAYLTIRDRLPVILTKVINNVNQAIFSLDPTTHAQNIQQGKSIIERISELRYHMQRDHPLLLLSDDLPDVKIWNDYLTTYCLDLGHFHAPWLTQECYIYRYLRQLFALSSSWFHYDPFQSDKFASLNKSIPVLLSIANHLNLLKVDSNTALSELILFSLWGNAVDLSLLAGSDTLDTHSLGQKMISQATAGVVVNDLIPAVNFILSLNNARIDFVLDNTGFELTSDLFLADSLISLGHASLIVFHVKAYPWFVSDTTQYDFDHTLTILATHLPTQVTKWRQWLNDNIWQVLVDPFWTYPHSYYHLPTFTIAQHLAKSSLVVFKGDLNYRKLVFDCQWDLTTPFAEAIGPLGEPGAFPPLLALRTCKSQVCVGLSSTMIDQLSQVKDWMTSGNYAVVSFKL